MLTSKAPTVGKVYCGSVPCTCSFLSSSREAHLLLFCPAVTPRPTSLDPLSSSAKFVPSILEPSAVLGVLPSTGRQVLRVHRCVQSDALIGEVESTKACKELPSRRVASGGHDRTSNQVLAIGSEVATALVCNATTIVAEVPVSCRVCLGKGQRSVCLPVDALSTWNHGCLHVLSISG